MAKKESTFVSMVATLSIVALVAAALLGGVYEVTKEPIRLADLRKRNEAIQAVVPAFDSVPAAKILKYGMDGDSLTLYPAVKDGQVIGTAVETFTNSGFSGLFKLMVGFDNSGNITDIAVLSHAETPGLGDKMERAKSDFHVQFMGKNPDNFKLAVTKDNGDVDAITASTITSRAYCEAVQRAYEAWKATRETSN